MAKVTWKYYLNFILLHEGIFEDKEDKNYNHE